MTAFSSFVAFEVQVQQKRLALFCALAVIKSERLSCAMNVTQHIVKVSTAEQLSALELFNAKIQSEAVAQNKCFETGEHSRLPCHLIAAFKAVLHAAL